MKSTLSAQLARLDEERASAHGDYALDALPLDWMVKFQGRSDTTTQFLIGLAQPPKVEVELLDTSSRGTR